MSSESILLTASRRVGEFSFTPLMEQDLPFLLEIRNECRSYLHDDRQFDLEAARAWFRAAKPTYYLTAMCGEAVGYFRVSDVSVGSRRLLAGADIHSNFRGQGIGYRAWKEFLDLFFLELNWNKISLEVLSTNERAYNLYKKLGFVLEGKKREEVWRADSWIDSIVMSILRAEWRSSSDAPGDVL